MTALRQWQHESRRRNNIFGIGRKITRHLLNDINREPPTMARRSWFERHAGHGVAQLSSNRYVIYI